MSQLKPSGRIVIVGAGNVGSSVAYSILNQDIASELLIVDIIEDFARAQAMDLQDASNFVKGIPVKYSTYSDIQDGDIIVITSGAPQKEGQTRLDLLQTNASIIKDVVSKINEVTNDAYIILVSNPVDILTYVAINESNLPVGRVFGSGTYLDSGRLRVNLSKMLNVNSLNIHAHILGEHGDSSFPVLSATNISGIKLDKFIEITDELYENLSTKVRNTAYEIIKGKKSTYYGIGTAVAKIVKAIIKNENRIMPVSVMLKGEYGHSDVCISVPAVINSDGVKIFNEIELNQKEKDFMANSVNILKDNISKIN